MNVFEKWTATGILESWEPRSVAHQGVVRNQRKEGEREREREGERERDDPPAASVHPLRIDSSSEQVRQRGRMERNDRESRLILVYPSILSYLLGRLFREKNFRGFCGRSNFSVSSSRDFEKQGRKKEGN